MSSLFIKNMVCDRCISSVKRKFDRYEVIYSKVLLGEVQINKLLPPKILAAIEEDLKSEGFELIYDTQPVLVTRMKAALVVVFSQEEISEDFKLSKFLTEKFPYDYSHLSRLFSHHEQDTIEHFVIKLRIEKAKELLTYKDQNISEIAYKIGYSSAAHFSRQFKKLVGVSPSQYRQNPINRTSIEKL